MLDTETYLLFRGNRIPLEGESEYFKTALAKMIAANRRPAHPISAYYLFSQEKRDELKNQGESTLMSKVKKRIHKEWNALEDKSKYQKLAQAQYLDFKRLIDIWVSSCESDSDEEPDRILRKRHPSVQVWIEKRLYPSGKRSPSPERKRQRITLPLPPMSLLAPAGENSPSFSFETAPLLRYEATFNDLAKKITGASSAVSIDQRRHSFLSDHPFSKEFGLHLPLPPMKSSAVLDKPVLEQIFFSSSDQSKKPIAEPLLLKPATLPLRKRRTGEVTFAGHLQTSAWWEDGRRADQSSTDESVPTCLSCCFTISKKRNRKAAVLLPLPSMN